MSGCLLAVYFLLMIPFCRVGILSAFVLDGHGVCFARWPYLASFLSRGAKSQIHLEIFSFFYVIFILALLSTTECVFESASPASSSSPLWAEGRGCFSAWMGLFLMRGRAFGDNGLVLAWCLESSPSACSGTVGNLGVLVFFWWGLSASFLASGPVLCCVVVVYTTNLRGEGIERSWAFVQFKRVLFVGYLGIVSSSCFSSCLVRGFKSQQHVEFYYHLRILSIIIVLGSISFSKSCQNCAS